MEHFAFQLHHGRNNPEFRMKSAAAQLRFQRLNYAGHPSHLNKLRHPFVRRCGMQNFKSHWTVCQTNAADLIIG
ncbi:MAG: hypothetical protein EBZ27_10755 [Rhodobacteraceae bacterium]|nr:hypothetical protein [Paracoccaceae bacterium]